MPLIAISPGGAGKLVALLKAMEMLARGEQKTEMITLNLWRKHHTNSFDGGLKGISLLMVACGFQSSKWCSSSPKSLVICSGTSLSVIYTW